MQFKLLNYHKLLANIANNVLGAFVPVIILKQTGSMLFAVLSFVAMRALKIALTQIVKPFINKKPQIMMLVRAIPILLNFVFLMLFSVNIYVGVIGYSISNALNRALKVGTNEVMFNYSTKDKSTKKIGVTRLFEDFGLIAATLIGGYLLDNISQFYVVIMAFSIYILSVVPLVIYYFKNKNKKGFNIEQTTNVALHLEEHEDTRKESKKVTKTILRGYGAIHFLIGCNDAAGTIFKLWLFTQNKTFALMGILNAIIYLFKGLSAYCIGKVDQKIDITPIAIVSCIVLGICQPAVLFVNNIYLYFLIMALIGITTPIMINFVYSRMLSKCKVLGISNKAIHMKIDVVTYGEITMLIPAMFGVLSGGLIIIGVLVALNGILIPKNEEISRKALVNLLENNEIK